MTPDDLLEVARSIATIGRTGRAEQAFRRRSISTSYYALFHALCLLCAEELAQRSGRGSVPWRRVYRALDHRLARDELNRLSRSAAFLDNTAFRALAQTFSQLQQARHDADYDPDPVFTAADAGRWEDQARSAIDGMTQLSSAERADLVTSLLFRRRQP